MPLIADLIDEYRSTLNESTDGRFVLIDFTTEIGRCKFESQFLDLSSNTALSIGRNLLNDLSRAFRSNRPEGFQSTFQLCLLFDSYAKSVSFLRFSSVGEKIVEELYEILNAFRKSPDASMLLCNAVLLLDFTLIHSTLRRYFPEVQSTKIRSVNKLYKTTDEMSTDVRQWYALSTVLYSAAVGNSVDLSKSIIERRQHCCSSPSGCFQQFCSDRFFWSNVIECRKFVALDSLHISDSSFVFSTGEAAENKVQPLVDEILLYENEALSKRLKKTLKRKYPDLAGSIFERESTNSVRSKKPKQPDCSHEMMHLFVNLLEKVGRQEPDENSDSLAFVMERAEFSANLFMDEIFVSVEKERILSGLAWNSVKNFSTAGLRRLLENTDTDLTYFLTFLLLSGMSKQTESAPNPEVLEELTARSASIIELLPLSISLTNCSAQPRTLSIVLKFLSSTLDAISSPISPKLSHQRTIRAVLTSISLINWSALVDIRDFSSAFLQVVNILSRILSKRRSGRHFVGSVECILSTLMSTFVKKFSSEPSVDANDEASSMRFRCARSFARLISSIATSQDLSVDFQKCLTYLLADFFGASGVGAFAAVSCNKRVRSALAMGVCDILDSCQENQVEFLASNLDDGSKHVFRQFYEEYKKYFKYHGYV